MLYCCVRCCCVEVQVLLCRYAVLCDWFLSIMAMLKYGCMVAGRGGEAVIARFVGEARLMCSSRNSTPMACRAVRDSGQWA